MASDPRNEFSIHLEALRHANDGFAITVWNSSPNGEAGWKLWRTLDAKYAEQEPGWLMTIPGNQIVQDAMELLSSGHPMKAHVPSSGSTTTKQ